MLLQPFYEFVRGCKISFLHRAFDITHCQGDSETAIRARSDIFTSRPPTHHPYHLPFPAPITPRAALRDTYRVFFLRACTPPTSAAPCRPDSATVSSQGRVRPGPSHLYQIALRLTSLAHLPDGWKSLGPAGGCVSRVWSCPDPGLINCNLNSVLSSGIAQCCRRDTAAQAGEGGKAQRYLI